MNAEDLKGCDEETKELMRDIFNEVIKQESMAPKSTIKIAIIVIYKKGDATRPENYCTPTTLYKVF